VLLSSETGRWHGRVRHLERLGADAIIYLDVPQLGELVARTEGETRLALGAEIFASPQPGAEHRFAG
jgi:multiple sugar transport system ATP-binding protein